MKLSVKWRSGRDGERQRVFARPARRRPAVLEVVYLVRWQKLAAVALVPRLAARLAPRRLRCGPHRSTRWVARRRPGRVLRCIPQPPLQVLHARRQLLDHAERHRELRIALGQSRHQLSEPEIFVVGADLLSKILTSRESRFSSRNAAAGPERLHPDKCLVAYAGQVRCCLHALASRHWLTHNAAQGGSFSCRYQQWWFAAAAA